jgi:ABC-type multidrug transport system fused ATPase/permease subunit
MTLASFCQWLQDTPWGTGIRESVWVFPIVEGTHVLALALSVGILLVMDLRLAGFLMRRQPVSQISNQLMPWSLAGFAIMFFTGALLFWSQAVKAYGSIFFRIKLVCLLLAGINALVFELTLRRTVATWDNDETPPFRARLAGVLGIVLWAGVIAAGRTMAYTF